MITFYRRLRYLSPWGCWLAIQVRSYGVRIGKAKVGHRLAIATRGLGR